MIAKVDIEDAKFVGFWARVTAPSLGFLLVIYILNFLFLPYNYQLENDINSQEETFFDEDVQENQYIQESDSNELTAEEKEEIKQMLILV